MNIRPYQPEDESQVVALWGRGTNSDVLRFYEHAGYCVEDRVSLGKRLYDEKR